MTGAGGTADGGGVVPPIGDTLVTSRPFDEYCASFGLSPGELLAGPVLDCPAGASDFAATVRGLGGRAVSVDPSYALGREVLARRCEDDLVRVHAWARGQTWRCRVGPDGTWDRIADWRASAERFLDDLARDRARRGGRYVAAALPQLPFPDGAFRLVVSGFLLFSYADRLDPEFHLAAVRELLRVSHGEVRLHPLNDYLGHPYAQLGALLDRLAEEGVVAEIRPVTSPTLAADNRTLVLSRPR